ncbi:fibroblast growth factor 1 [Nematostella vectensis]|uniref:fibroblast growth factor 1 n=1 Tax=Nematostella vectensis TaxID=45351 RepID=UPI0020777B90|nr:fibroblast growth factor 1 [Nematostella vectensis]
MMVSVTGDASEVAGRPRFARRRRLYCTNGFYLEIGYNGAVKGTRNKLSQLAIMEIIPHIKGTIYIRGSHSGFFLAVDKQGKLYTTKLENNECVFTEKLTPDFYDTYTCERSNETRMVGVLARTGAAVSASQSTLRRSIHGRTQCHTQFLSQEVYPSA